MTARQEARAGSAAASSDAWSYETQRAPNVGEILQTARQRKGVDLSRAERETKIRARHLMALESGDFNDLPAQVYAKGFLRNYSTYLGLDAEEVLARWRTEIDQPRSAETVKVKPPPQPITAPSRGLKLTSGLIVALILAAIVFAFVGYVGLQLVRFTQNPEITVNGPSVRTLQPGADRIILTGSGTPEVQVTATGTDDLFRTTTASSRGTWTLDLPVSKGRNDFTIVNTDPETARESEPLQVIATVPVVAAFDGTARTAPALPAGAAASASGTPSAELDVSSPSKGFKSASGKVKVAGSSDADNVLVSFQWLGKEAKEKRAPAPRELAVEEGAFRGVFRLPEGRWQVSVAAAVDGGAPAVATIPVRSTFDKMVVKVIAVDGFTRIKLTDEAVDEVIVDGVRLEPGQSRTFTTNGPVELRVGNARAANISVDGVEYGAMGNKPEAKTWRIEQGKKPKTIS